MGTYVMLQAQLGTGPLDSLPASAYSHARLHYHLQMLHVSLGRVAHHQLQLSHPDCMYDVSIKTKLKSKRSAQLPITILRSHSP